VYAVFWFLVLVISTGTIDFLVRLISEMTYYVSNGALNSMHPLTHAFTRALSQRGLLDLIKLAYDPRCHRVCHQSKGHMQLLISG